ncbi:MAG TPA: fibronectin type III domain-containing protein, partial [Gemmatimonadales bacterium]|nr:fibronectin type III domain-containing protein [Gemmatimonadales bacterium]
MQRTLTTGDTLITVPTANLPLIRRTWVSGISSSDSADYVRPDSVRAVRMNFRLTNGKTGNDQHYRDVTTTIETPNNGIPLPTVCGRAPIAPTSLTATDTIPGSGIIWLSWPSSVDQDAGEEDVQQYILYRRLSSDTTWSDPLEVVRTTAGNGTYSTQISDNIPGTAYTFGVSAQDCTPSESTVTTRNVTASVGP